MAIQPLNTYSGLQSAVLRWMEDPTLTDEVIELIGLSENRLSRLLSSPEMEVATTLAITNGVVTMPADFMELRAVYIDFDDVRTPLRQESIEDFNRYFSSDCTARPAFYAMTAGNMVLRPLPDDTYTVSLTYKQFLPSLSASNPTNWLLTKWPDLYLAHTLLTAVDYGFESDRLDWATNKVATLVDEINTAGRKRNYGAGPLVARAPVGDIRFAGGYYNRGGYVDNTLLDSNGDYLVDG